MFVASQPVFFFLVHFPSLWRGGLRLLLACFHSFQVFFLRENRTSEKEQVTNKRSFEHLVFCGFLFWDL